MNIIYLGAFKKKKADKMSVVEDKPVGSMADVRYPPRPMAPDSDLDRFTREALQFKFQNMRPAMFVTVNSEQVPDPSNDDNPFPPMVA